MAVFQAKRFRVSNLSLLVFQVLIPPIIESIIGARDNKVGGVLAPGHVCTITGFSGYERITRLYRIPIVITGFEPADILKGIYMCIAQLEEGRAEVENQYSRSVQPEGNPKAQQMMGKIFRIKTRKLRGIGTIPNCGLALSEEYGEFDAEKHFGPVRYSDEESGICISGRILRGVKKPYECPAFGKACTPDQPLGATMVSSEGTCAAYYAYRKNFGGKSNGSVMDDLP